MYRNQAQKYLKPMQTNTLDSIKKEEQQIDA